jgi:hypothetical protein
VGGFVVGASLLRLVVVVGGVLVRPPEQVPGENSEHFETNLLRRRVTRGQCYGLKTIFAKKLAQKLLLWTFKKQYQLKQKLDHNNGFQILNTYFLAENSDIA